MVILKTLSKREPCKFIGAFLPQWIHEYFALYSLAKGESKSAIIRSVIEKWVDDHSHTTEGREDALISEVTQKIKYQWKLERVAHSNTMLSVFKTTVKAELVSRGLRPQHIETILKEVS